MSLLNWLMRVAKYLSKFGIKGFFFLLKIKITGKQKISITTSHYGHPIFIRNKTTDIYPFHQILISEEYNVQLGFTPSVIFDLGANIGLASVYFKNKFPYAQIIAVEPEPSNFSLLKENVSPYKDVMVYPCGIWNKTTHLIIRDEGLGNWGFSVQETNNVLPGSVKAMGISDIMDELKIEQIDLLKIDIEGSEKELFEANYERWLPKVKVIIIELHDILRPGASQAFFNAIRSYDFQLVQHGENLICYLDRSTFKKAVS